MSDSIKNKIQDRSQQLEEHNYKYYSGTGKLLFNFRSNDLFSDYDFSRINMEAINITKLGKFDLRTRYFIQFGSGSNIPFESSLMLAGANSEELLDDKYTRSRGFFPDEWVNFSETTGHFHAGGGLNLRGYAGYLAAETNDLGEVYLAYSGVSGTSVNVEFRISDDACTFLDNHFNVLIFICISVVVFIFELESAQHPQ